MIPFNELQQKYFSLNNTRTLILGNTDKATVSSAELLANLGSEVIFVSPRSERMLFIRENWQTLGFPIEVIAYEKPLDPNELFRRIKQKISILDYMIYAEKLNSEQRLLLSSTDEFEYAHHQPLSQFMNACQYTYPLLKMAKSPCITCLVIKPQEFSPHLYMRQLLTESLIHFAKIVSQEVRHDAIRVNSVVYQETHPQDPNSQRELHSETKAYEQIAQLLALLCYPASACLSGQTIWVEEP